MRSDIENKRQNVLVTVYQICVCNMENDLMKIDKLHDASNWSIWKFQVRVLLKASELWSVVDGTADRPASDPDSAITAAASATGIQKWERSDCKAQKIIVTSVGKEPLIHIMNCNSSRDMWVKLEEIYEQKTQTSIHLIQQKFYSFTKESNDNMATHISKLNTIVQQLKDLGENISDSMVVTKILMTLPTTYSHFFSAWESTAAPERTLNNLTSRLMMEESRIQSVSDDGAASGALVARKGFSKPNWKQKSDSKPGRCFRCKKQGHWKTDCPMRNHDQEKGNSKGNAFVSEVALMAESSDTQDWVIDSGASDHMTNRREWFSEYKTLEKPIPVRIGNGDTIFAHGIGEINVLMFDKSNWVNGHLVNVLYVPDIRINLFSSACALDKGLVFVSNKNQCELKRGDKTVAVGIRHNRLFKLLIKVKNASSVVANTTVKCDSIKLWHERLCHQNVVQVKCWLKKMNIAYTDMPDFKCIGCIYGKQHRSSFQHSNSRASRVGELIHTDVCGPMQVKSLGGARFFLLLKDDYSNYRTVFFLKEKSEVCSFINEYINVVAKEHTIKVLRSDNGTEFVNRNMEQLLKKNGITHQRSVPYTPEQNGRAERDMRTIVESARTMLQTSEMNMNLWAEAVNTAVYVLNRSASCSVKCKTPYELWFNKKQVVESFTVFGADAYTHVPKEKRQKWDSKSRKGCFVGYSDNTKGYRVYYSNENKVQISRDIIFDEIVRYNAANEPKREYKDFVIFSDEEGDHHEPAIMEKQQKILSTVQCDNADLESTTNNELVEISDDDDDFADAEDAVNTRSLRDRKKMPRPDYRERNSMDIIDEDSVTDPNNLVSSANVLMAEAHAFVSLLEPQTYQDALKSSERKHWIAAMDDEVQSLQSNNTWVLAKLPEGRTAIDNRWVFKVKHKAGGGIERFKARLVIRGFRQRYGVDYEETFSPVVKFSSVRMILSMAAAEKWHLKQFDVKTAFLYGDLDETIYMKQPCGYSDNSERVCLLKKSLYGLKQASRCWNKKFSFFLRKFNFESSKADPCVFISDRSGRKLVLAIYIDDGLVAASNTEDINELLDYLKKHFEIKVCDVGYFLGLEILVNESGSIHLHQSTYAEKVLARYGMEASHPVAVPADTSINSIEAHETVGAINFPFRESVGSLMYLAVATRPDISYAVSSVSRHLENPNQAAVNAVKRILRYIKSSYSHGIIFSSNLKINLTCFSDADFAGNIATRKSTSGYVCIMGGGAISWASQRQRCVALSTTESEYIAASQAVKELVWLSRLQKELIPDIQKPILYMDNQSAIRLIKNPEFHNRTKHIDVRYHFIREKFESQMFELIYVKTEEQTADILTKPLARDKFSLFRTAMGIKPV